MKQYRLITFCCKECGNIVKVLIKKDGGLIFSILDKLHSSNIVLSESGYFKCIISHNETNIRFEYIYN